ncbi:MAG: alpha/beta fold hydrolase [Solirubrobacterales bacterium]
MTSRLSRADVVAAHRSSGRSFTAGGIESFVLEKGSGEPVVMMHGVPASSFLYRKVIDQVAENNLRGIAFDLPGLGMAERPQQFDYSWSGLGNFACAAVDELGLDRFHLVVHDIGGPVGFEIAARFPERVSSMTILNTLIAVDGFVKPWVMRPFGIRGLGEAWLASMNGLTFLPLMYAIGVKDRRATTRAEVAAYVDLLKRVDRGKAFLKIMRGFETTAEKQRLYVETLQAAKYPIEIVWAKDDPALGVKTKGAAARELLPQAGFTAIPGKHFFQEDQAPAIAARISAAVSRSRAG